MVVLVIDACPRYTCMARISWPLFIIKKPQPCLNICGFTGGREALLAHSSQILFTLLLASWLPLSDTKSHGREVLRSRRYRRSKRNSSPAMGCIPLIPFFMRFTKMLDPLRSSCYIWILHSSDTRKPCRYIISKISSLRTGFRVFRAAFRKASISL